jgi:hypothetical protein
VSGRGAVNSSTRAERFAGSGYAFGVNALLYGLTH